MKAPLTKSTLMKYEMPRRLRIRTKYRKPLGEDQIALAFLMLAKQMREEARKDTDAEPLQNDTKRRTE